MPSLAMQSRISSVPIFPVFVWTIWAFIHLMYLVQFQSCILVFVQRAIQDRTFNRGGD